MLGFNGAQTSYEISRKLRHGFKYFLEGGYQAFSKREKMAALVLS